MEHTVDTPQARTALSQAILGDIDAFSVQKYNDGHRNHLGASLIGRECSRYLWYVFRWVKRPVFEGRILRLFQRGHREEPALIEYLRGIGCWVSELQQDGETQHRISAVHGHFGGSLDSFIQLPPRYGNMQLSLGEFKTSNDKQFKKLQLKGVIEAKPEHYAQMSTYGKFYSLEYALYLCVNKNDDAIYIEIVKLDFSLADDMIRKAEYVITSTTPPPKISADRTDWRCKFCDVIDVCHYNAPIEQNCRSCADACPTYNAEWHCMKYNCMIDKEKLMPFGCADWRPVA